MEWLKFFILTVSPSSCFLPSSRSRPYTYRASKNEHNFCIKLCETKGRNSSWLCGHQSSCHGATLKATEWVEKEKKGWRCERKLFPNGTAGERHFIILHHPISSSPILLLLLLLLIIHSATHPPKSFLLHKLMPVTLLFLPALIHSQDKDPAVVSPGSGIHLKVYFFHAQKPAGR